MAAGVQCVIRLGELNSGSPFNIKGKGKRPSAASTGDREWGGRLFFNGRKGGECPLPGSHGGADRGQSGGGESGEAAMKYGPVRRDLHGP